ncbi:MAG: polymorphic toxin type 17 domain-containing protein, partial [Actinomycetota bacterium]|nr:polymorphic toxin type 17 domain-containing protein [Actinomycetota bacterium]
AGAVRDDDRPFAFVATPGGLVAYARRGKRGDDGGGASGGGGRKPTKEEVLTELRLPHGKGVPFAFEPDPKWRPEQRLKWDPEQRGYVDAKRDVWRKGPSRTPGDPFEWDVQLRKTSRWQRHSKDGKHVNINLSGRISH